MTARIRTFLFAICTLVLGVLAFGVEPFDSSTLIDAVFLLSALGFVLSAVGELIAGIYAESDRSGHGNFRDQLSHSHSHNHKD